MNSKNFRLVIDPGHGGVDPGAVGPSGVKEKDVNLAVARKLAKILDPYVFTNVTRYSDMDVPLEKRVKIANNWPADLFVSIHCNSTGIATAEGFEILVWGEMTIGLAQCILDALTSAFPGMINRGVKIRPDLYVLSHTICKACIVELGFLSNPHEEQELASEAFQDRAANAIATGLDKYYGFGLVPANPKVVIGKNSFEGVIIENTLYGPVRALAAGLGFSGVWDSRTRTFTIIQ